MGRFVEIGFDDLRELVDGCYRYEDDEDEVPVCGCCGVPEHMEHKESCPIATALDILYMEGSIY